MTPSLQEQSGLKCVPSLQKLKLWLKNKTGVCFSQLPWCISTIILCYFWISASNTSFKILYAKTGKLDKALVVHACLRLLMCQRSWTEVAAHTYWGFVWRGYTGLVTSSTTTLFLLKEDWQRKLIHTHMFLTFSFWKWTKWAVTVSEANGSVCCQWYKWIFFEQNKILEWLHLLLRIQDPTSKPERHF